MKWITEEEVKSFISARDYDVRKTHNARWIDQKCAADVVSIIADCVLTYTQDNSMKTEFTSREIWFSDYALKNVKDVFKKVDVDAGVAENEYDKFFQQPIKMFVCAGILTETKRGVENYYSVVNLDMLCFLALRERNVLVFMNLYIEKVLKDSGIWKAFKDFFQLQTKDAYESMKKTFSSFTISNTKIGNKTSKGGANVNAGIVECNRIFIKVINPLSYCRNSLGTEKGRLSKQNITYDMLMYNRGNFRDIYAEKPKNVSRKEYMLDKKIVVNAAYFQYLSTKAKKQLRLYNDIFRGSKSEMPGDLAIAINMHHIFPESEFPEISYYLENLIALTPNQHIIEAHPKGATASINKDYQHKCLLVKSDAIDENIAGGEEKIYSFDGFKFVLTTGLADETFMDVCDSDYDGIKTKINLAYS